MNFNKTCYNFSFDTFQNESRHDWAFIDNDDDLTVPRHLVENNLVDKQFRRHIIWSNTI